MSFKPTSYVGTKEEYERTRESLDRMCIARTEPIEYSEFPKKVGDYIWQIGPGLFTFVDETENFNEFLYATLEDARIALKLYADWL